MSHERRALARIPSSRLNTGPHGEKSDDSPGIGRIQSISVNAVQNSFYQGKKATRVFVTPPERTATSPLPEVHLSHLLDPKRVQTVNGQPYLTLQKIGNGGSSKVYKVLGPNASVYAIKQVDIGHLDEAVIRSFENEINLLRQLQPSERIITLIDSEVNWSQAKISLVLELGDIDLGGLIEKSRADDRGVDPNFLRVMWQQMLEAVETVHQAKVIHGDLKPANFMFVSGKLKLIDFGISMSIASDRSTTSIERSRRVGTINYMSPESLQLQPSRHHSEEMIKLGRHADVWSLGCILYQLVYNRSAFPQSDLFEKICAICDESYEIPLPFVDGRADFFNLRDVILRCLQRDPKKRPTITELLDHPYLTLRQKDVEDDLLRFITAVQEKYPCYDFNTTEGIAKLDRVKQQLLNGEAISLD
jgi:serine/threonine-protein kinase TTK/MPS1